MPNFHSIAVAREKAIRIKDFAASFRRERIEREESDADIREALRAKSASAFVVSRLQWRIDNGLNTSREVLR